MLKTKRNYNITQVDFSELKGKAIKNIIEEDDFIMFETAEGSRYEMYHDQSCCERVCLEEVVGGNLRDLIGQTILEASEETNSEDEKKDEYDSSFTWTFYKIRTLKTDLTIRWYGTSNGYYSEEVSFYEIELEE